MGREALVTMIALSMCVACIRGSSHLSAWSKLMNPKLPVIMLNESRSTSSTTRRPADLSRWLSGWRSRVHAASLRHGVEQSESDGMTTRNLDALFRPASIALIGASNRAGSVGAVIARNLFEAGFEGPILTVNPHERAIRSSLNYARVADLPIQVDLAVIAAEAENVPQIIADLGAKGCRAAVAITAGFAEGDRPVSRELRQSMLDAARPHLLRIVGPNCLGFISTAARINASYAHLMPKTGDVAFVTQSGAMATTVLDWASARGVGFSHVISM
eukprot:gene49646-60774_t